LKNSCCRRPLALIQSDLLEGFAMMGPRQVAQGVLFYGLNLDALVPQDHLLRSINRCVDLSDV